MKKQLVMGSSLLMEVTNVRANILFANNELLVNNILFLPFCFVSKESPNMSRLKTTWAKLKKYKYQEAGNKYVIQKLFGIIMCAKETSQKYV